jgi:hypothetical protein
MGKNNDDDALEKLREWQEHQYNPGYWINRFPFGFPPKNKKWLVFCNFHGFYRYSLFSLCTMAIFIGGYF